LLIYVSKYIRYNLIVKVTNEKLKELLVGPGHISEADFMSAAEESGKRKIEITRLLVDMGFISDENLGKIIADGLDYRFIDLRAVRIPDDLLVFIPEAVAYFEKAIIFDRDNDILKLGTVNPDNYEFIKLLERKTGYKIEAYYATLLGMEEAMRYYKANLSDRVADIIKSLEKNSNTEENIVNLVNLLLEYAHDNKASDIHIEPLERNVSTRFRIDGVLHEVAVYPKNLHDKIVFRIKIMARLRTDEHAAAQDGRFAYKAGSAEFDVRVSVMPVTNGENVVMRLLSERSRRLTLENLGLADRDLEKVKRAAEKPYGMLLTVGPTGSGKTTTLYAILQILNKPEVNIMTIEDPVEYEVEHVQQTQVNSKKNLTFDTGLQYIVRQDPDIIMVGEIRDNETAKIAVNASMTGHLLLSTMHANDAATTFPRLIDMGVEPFLVASSVNVVISQRLVRKICEKCRASYSLSEDEAKALGEIMGSSYDPSGVRLYKGVGCKVCGNTGYSGRIGIFEVMEVSEALRPLIVGKEPSSVINKRAKELGMTSILEDGIAKTFKGVTTLEEIIRATKS